MADTLQRPVVTFVIPVRHPDNAPDWAALVGRLQQTCRSIAQQTNAAWKAVIVANHGAEVPPLPAQCEVHRVSFPPNAMHERGQADQEAFYDAVRLDKGRRVLAGMLAAGPSDFLMVVDDDDFVHRDLVTHAAANRAANGWYISRGLIWSDGGNLAYIEDQFDRRCGTSLIIRSDLYDLPDSFEGATTAFIMRRLGSHVFMRDILVEKGAPLAPLPFPGAVYRIGHQGAHSQSKRLLATYILVGENLRRPKQLLGRLLRLRLLSDQVRREYGLPRAGSASSADGFTSRVSAS